MARARQMFIVVSEINSDKFDYALVFDEESGVEFYEDACKDFLVDPPADIPEDDKFTVTYGWLYEVLATSMGEAIEMIHEGKAKLLREFSTEPWHNFRNLRSRRLPRR